MKIKNKLLIVIIFFLVTFIFSMYINNYNENIYENSTEKKYHSSNSLSIMLETKAGSGIYELSKSGSWSSDKYEFNETLSKCENGSQLIWNEEKRSVSLKTNISDRCYIYFDINLPDIFIKSNNSIDEGNTITFNCDNSNASYNEKYNRIEISNINGKSTNCDITFSKIDNKVYLNDYIISLTDTQQGNGMVINEKGYRYEGKNPNNYVWFNNELWRIIGVFDSSSHGVEGKNLVKIIRNETLGGLAWNKANSSDFTSSSINIILNNSYYYAVDGTNSGHCYGSGPGPYQSATAVSNCDYTKKGIQKYYRDMVAKVTWYLGGGSARDVTTDYFYEHERGTEVYGNRLTSTTGYIGLIYPSDYGYSVLASNCARTRKLNNDDYITCASSSWIFGKGNEWTISIYSADINHVFGITSYGFISSPLVYRGEGFRPVLYLEDTVLKISGDGSQNNPYIIRK